MATRTKTLSAVHVDTSGLDQKLRSLDKQQLPFARSLAINLLAKDTIRIEQIEMQDVFERPKPFVVRGLRMLKTAKKKEDPQFAVIGFSDVTGKFGNRAEAVVKAHIEGEHRGSKGLEHLFRRFGIMTANQFLVPGRHAPRDRYGNVDRTTITLAINFFKQQSTETRRRIARARQTGAEIGIFQLRHSKADFFVARVNAPISNYWGRGSRPSKKSTRRIRLIWIVADYAPRYQKRFDFYGEAEEHARKFGGYFGRQALNRALATAR